MDQICVNRLTHGIKVIPLLRIWANCTLILFKFKLDTRYLLLKLTLQPKPCILIATFDMIKGNELGVRNIDSQLHTKKGDKLFFSLFLNFKEQCSYLRNQMPNWHGDGDSDGVWIKMDFNWRKVICEHASTARYAGSLSVSVNTHTLRTFRFPSVSASLC